MGDASKLPEETVEPKVSALANGLRVVTLPLPFAKSLATYVLVGTGSRNEVVKNNGVSHFLEHMFYRGSVKRPSKLELSKPLEYVGGAINGHTGRQITGFYTVTLKDDFDIALDVMADMLLHPKLYQTDVDAEKPNVLRELGSYHDNAAIWARFLYSIAMWPGQGLGLPMLGTRESLAQVNRPELKDYYEQWYKAPNIALVVAGNIEHERVLDAAEAKLSEFSGSKPPTVVKESFEAGSVRTHAEERTAKEAHICLGFRAYPFCHEYEYALTVLDTVLGGAKTAVANTSMSCRLFQEIREKRGLAYNVLSYYIPLVDTGFWHVYAAFDPARLEESVTELVAQLAQAKDEPVGEPELNKAKRQLVAARLIEADAPAPSARSLGERLVLTDEILTADEERRRIEAVTADDVQRVARDLFRRDTATIVTVGEVTQERCAKLADLLTPLT